MVWYKTYGFHIDSVSALTDFKHYLEQIMISETIDVGRYINDLLDTDLKNVRVCLQDESLVYCRLCEDCGQLGDLGVSNTACIELRKVVCKKCGHCLVLQDPTDVYSYEDAMYMLEELNEMNNNPTDY